MELEGYGDTIITDEHGTIPKGLVKRLEDL